ncbi:hypothetical protein BY458DRAFT_557371 [Sporodiniella umbellata]|nr:hypothetical protein BY458DRAFT_557371 [Sporodiniella umbellata]
MRSAAHLSTGTKKDPLKDYLDKIDQNLIREQKIASKQRIPLNVTSKISNQVESSVLLSLHSNLTSDQHQEAWKTFDKATLPLGKQPIPPATAKLLLKSLQKDVITHQPKLLLKLRKLEHLYSMRLEKLVGITQKSYLWETPEFCTIIELYGRLSQVNRAESILRHIFRYCQDAPSIEVYNELIAVYVRRFRGENDLTKKRYISKMDTILQEISRKGLEPNTTTYNLLLAAKVKFQDLKGAEKVYSKMTTPPNRMTYNILLNGFSRGGKTPEDKIIIDEWMARMIASGISPDLRTFKNLIDGLVEQTKYHAQMGEKEEMDTAVQSASDIYAIAAQFGHDIDLETTNNLLRCYTAANNSEKVEKIVGMLALPEKKGGCGNCGCSNKDNQDKKQEPLSKQITPDLYTFNILIKHHLSNGNVNKAFQTYDTMVTMDHEPDVVTYSNFISYYTKQGKIEEGLKYLDVMQKKGIPTNIYIYNILLSSSVKYPEYSHLISPHLNSIITSGTVMDSISRNILILKSSKKDNLDTSFENLLDSLDQNLFSVNDNEFGTNISTRTHNTLLQAAGQFYKSRRERFAQELGSVMSTLNTSNVRPDMLTFALSIRNACYQGDMERAEAIYKSMVKAGIKPNTYVFSHLIYGYSLTGKLDKALDTLEKMPSYNVLPNAINYAPLIKACVDSAEYQKAHSLFEKMLSRNIKADISIYTIIAEAFLQQESCKKAIDLLESVEKSGIRMDLKSLTLLVDAYGLDAESKMEIDEKSFEQVDSLKNCLNIHTIKINNIYSTLRQKKWLDPQAVFVLLEAHIRMKNLGAAWALWNECIPLGILHSAHYNLLITGFSKDKTWYPIARMTYDNMVRENGLRANAFTFDTMIWSAYVMDDSQTIKELWCSPDRRDIKTNMPYALMVRTYYAVISTMLKSNMLSIAKSALKEYQTIPSSPDSSTIWNKKIGRISSTLRYN